jgi:tetratricopeptide (TPR) repeat protein
MESRTVFAGVCHLSKLSQLKQDAYQAGKKKDWDQAVSIYEKILELEKNNPTVVNEMGDLCLKAGESSRAVTHFLKAASKYRKTGLLNNAVAIYKKILRHDPDNLNAHWYLAETRASQGLTHEGEEHGLRFLTSSEEVSGELKEIFLGRCRELFALYPESKALLEQLLKIFRSWNLNLEAGRTLCLLACLQLGEGQEEEARQGMDDLLERSPEVANYPEYNRWNSLVNPATQPQGEFSSFGEVSFGEDSPPADEAGDTPAATVPEPEPEPVAAPVAEAEPEPAAVPSADPDPGVSETSFGDIGLQDEPETPTVEIPAAEPDDDGCFSLDADDGASLDDLVAQAASAANEPEPAPEPAPAPDHSRTGDIDLLAEILADDSDGVGFGEEEQLDTITREIGTQVGGDEGQDDADRLYEMGLVYLEMGLFDQACESLQKAAEDTEFAVRAREMWGIALSRASRPDEAVDVLEAGLEAAKAGSQEFLGLLYHIGRAHEQAGRMDEALAHYTRIQEQDRSYLDVGKRVAALTTV